MSKASTIIKFPVGRMVEGSLYKGSDTDLAGQKKVYKTGPQAGQPRVDFWFCVAFPKNGVDWRATPWGQQMQEAARTAHPQFWNHPSYKYKVIDGDSREKAMQAKRAPFEKEGYPGHWIVRFSSTYAPPVCAVTQGADGKPSVVELKEENRVVPGYFVRVVADVSGNTGDSPGLYMNPKAVVFAAEGEVINVGLDLNSLGLAEDMAGMQLPAGAVPISSANISADLAAGMLPGAPMAPGASAAPVYTMTPAAGGFTREQYHAQGWSDADLIAKGMMIQQ